MGDGFTSLQDPILDVTEKLQTVLIVRLFIHYMRN